MNYPAVTIENASEELNRLHANILINQKEARVLTRQYNKIAADNMKSRDKEALMEYHYCARLDELGIEYARQVSVGHGRIDVLTSDTIIELKYGSGRSVIFEAIGQLIYYRTFYPNRKCMIVITAKPRVSMAEILSELGIELEVFHA